MAVYWSLICSGIAIAGSLYLSLGMGLRACPLCFYQRTFAFALVGVLSVGLITELDTAKLMTLAFPLAVGGFGVALLHSAFVWTGTFECPRGVLDLRTAPEQSLTIFTLILAGFIYQFWLNKTAQSLEVKPMIMGLLLGVASVYGSHIANPPPIKPTAPYPTDEKILTCRFPYRG